MKTLVIHPQDHTTDFLMEIYKDTDWTVINKRTSTSALKAAILAHDRIIMLGHGDEYGLYGHGDYLLTSKFVYLLREKECIAIWCNADVFFKKYELKGIYSGMIISEYEEAMLYCIHDFKQSQIDSSNELFALAAKESIQSDDPLETFHLIYTGDSNPIIQFNKQNFYTTAEKFEQQ
jgi:hypothetical protein